MIYQLQNNRQVDRLFGQRIQIDEYKNEQIDMIENIQQIKIGPLYTKQLNLVLILQSLLQGLNQMSSNSESDLIEFGSECYQVQAIRDRKFVKGNPHYFIKWKGWAQHDNTWEPLQNLQTVLNLVKEYDALADAKTTNLKDKKINQDSKPTHIPSPQDLSKKTKPIHKDKKNPKSRSEQSKNDVSFSESESVSNNSSKQKTTKRKNDKHDSKIDKNESRNDQNESIKKILAGEKQKQIEREKTKVKQKQVEKNKLSEEKKGRGKQRSREKILETTMSQKGSLMAVNQQKQAQTLTQANRQSSLSKQVQQSSGDLIEITRINYHLLITDENLSQTGRLYYNVDRRNRITKKAIPVAEITSEELIKKNKDLLVEYLQNFVKEVEMCAMEQREIERRSSGQVNAMREVRLGMIGKMRK